MSIIERLELEMDRKSLKYTDLADLLKINKSVISNWRSRKTDPPAKYIVLICEFLGVSLSFLLSGVLFGVVLSPGFSQIWIIPLALVGSLISGFLAGFLLNKAQYLIRTHIYERFRHTKAAQAAAYIMLFVMSAAAILIVWCVRSMWF